MTIALIVIALGTTLPSSVAYGNSYERMGFGYNNCNVQWGDLRREISEAQMISLATQVNANGFTYHPSLRYGKLMIGGYPKDCQSPPNESWPLYLLVTAPSPSVSDGNSYERMDFGYNNCDAQWGDLRRGISEAQMISLATQANAKGFTYHPSLRYGKLLIGNYPKKCQSPPNESWPLYLLSKAPKAPGSDK